MQASSAGPCTPLRATLAGDEDERCRRSVGTRGVHGIGALGLAWVRRSGIGDWASESFRNIAKTALRRLPVMKRELRWSPSHPLRLIQNHKAGNFTLADPHVCAGALSTTRLDAPDLSEVRAPIDCGRLRSVQC